jgi:hypothetical protein
LRAHFTAALTIAFLMILLLQTALPVAASKNERELAYDNGTVGGSASLPYVPHRWSGGAEEVNEEYQWIGNSMFAVRFTPDIRDVEILLGVRFYIAGDPESFRVWILDSNRIFLTNIRGYFGPAPGSQLISSVRSWTVTPTSTGWNYLNVTDVADPMFIADDFYVAIEFTAAQKPRLGVDTASPISNRGWYVDNQSTTGWIEYSTYAKEHGLAMGNLMIRASVSPIYNMTRGTTTLSTGISLEMPASIVLVILVAAAIGVWQIGKRRQVKGATEEHKSSL